MIPADMMSNYIFNLFSFIKFGIKSVANYNKNKEHNYILYEEQLQQAINKINNVLQSVLSDDSILNLFNGFKGRYLHSDVKRETVEFLFSKESIYYFKIEYVTGCEMFDKQYGASNIDFSKSASKRVSNKNLIHQGKDEKLVIDESQNTTSIEHQTFVYDHKERPIMEKDFIKKIYSTISTKGVKKVVFENKAKFENPISSFIRIVAYNGNHNNIP